MGNIGNMLDMTVFQAVASFFPLGQHIWDLSQLLPLLPFAFS